MMKLVIRSFFVSLMVIWLTFCRLTAYTQAIATPDSLHNHNITDTLLSLAPAQLADTSLNYFYRLNAQLNIDAPLDFRIETFFNPVQNDLVFYILVGLLLLLGFIRLLFTKYFNDLFRIFLQTNFRQKSMREQLLQNKTASLFFNVFFCVSAGLFLYFTAIYHGWLLSNNFLQKVLFCTALVAIIYTIKFIGLQFSGWLFGVKDMAETYLFIVFLINKVMGVLLLPATIILALGHQQIQPVLLTISLISIGFFYVYRYFIAFPLVRNNSGMTGFHFFVYLCAFEIVPVMVIYKFLLLTLDR